MLYTGAMEKGQMHGKGALVYPNGEKYEGDFQHGKRHGYGVYSYADGGRFEGEWVDDKVHGRGYRPTRGNRYANFVALAPRERARDATCLGVHNIGCGRSSVGHAAAARAPKLRIPHARTARAQPFWGPIFARHGQIFPDSQLVRPRACL